MPRAVIVPILGTGRYAPGLRGCPISGGLSAGVCAKPDWPVSHSALPGRSGWVTFAAFFYNQSYKEPRHE